MKTHYLLLFARACAVRVAAQDAPADTVQSQQLNEVVVEAQMQGASPTALTYIPTARQKKCFANGYGFAAADGHTSAANQSG